MGSVDARLSVGGFVSGLPHNRRRPELSVLVGFHSANGWSQVGMLAIGTKALDTNVIGKMTVPDKVLSGWRKMVTAPSTG